MKRPPIFPPPQFPPVRLRAFQRMPPAVFPAIMGLFGLGLALRRGAETVGYPPAFAEVLLGAVSLLWIFATLGYAAKISQRIGVVMEDLAILPGRTGLAALSLGLHAVLALLVTLALIRGPAEGRHVTPAWHLHFVGFIIAGLSAAPLGYHTLGLWILGAMVPVATLLWALSLWQLFSRIPPAPLRPLLAIHLAPASLLGTVAAFLGLIGVATGFAILGGLILLALLASSRWITASGFSALWGAFTFPLAAYTSLLMVLARGNDLWVWPALACLIAAIGIVPWIAAKVMQAWTKGTLAAKTNAATA